MGALVIGLGSDHRSDDAAGLEVARRIGAGRGIAHAGDPLAVIDLWGERDDVVVVDAMRSGAAPGTTFRFDATTTPLPRAAFATSHSMGIGEAIELARVLGSLPSTLAVIGIEIGTVETGHGLSPPVTVAVDRLVEELSRA